MYMGEGEKEMGDAAGHKPITIEPNERKRLARTVGNALAFILCFVVIVLFCWFLFYLSQRLVCN